MAAIDRWRTVRVFISSTFRDMHAERDHLVRVVFPRLRERLEPFRVQLIDIDLRWGVTRALAESDRTLELCLDQIDRCRPFFVGILGQRYGWIPAQVLPGDQRSSVLDRWRDKSVTELEILHGVLEDQAMQGRALFCFRDPAALSPVPAATRDLIYEDSDPALRERLVRLKERIRRTGLPLFDGYPARWDDSLPDRWNEVQGRFVHLDAFGERVADALWDSIREDLNLPGQAVAQDLPDADAGDDADAQDRFIELRGGLFVGREVELNGLRAYAAGDEPAPMVVVGPAGRGKTSLLARLVGELRQQPGIMVVHHFVGATRHSTSLRHLLTRLCDSLEEFHGLPARESAAETSAESPADAQRRFLELVHRRLPAGAVRPAHRPARIILVLAGLDQLDSGSASVEWEWLPDRLPPEVRLVLSCARAAGDEADDPLAADPGPLTVGRRLLRACRLRKLIEVSLPPLDDAQCRTLIRALPSLSAKTLDDEQIQLLLDNPSIREPLYLTVALEELRGFGSFEQLRGRIAGFPRGPTAQSDLWQQVLSRLEDDLGRAFVVGVLAPLAASREGLRELELVALASADGAAPFTAGDPAGDVAVLLRLLRVHMVRVGDLLRPAHTSLRIAMDDRYLSEPLQRVAVHRRLADLLATQPAAPRVWRERARQLSAAAGRLEGAPEWDALADLLSDPDCLHALAEHDIEELVRYWRELETLSSHRLVDAWRYLRESPLSSMDEYETTNLVARLLASCGHSEDSLSLRERQAEFLRTQDADHRWLPGCFSVQALLLLSLDRPAEALALLDEAERRLLAQGRVGELGFLYSNQAIALRRVGRKSEANKKCEEAVRRIRESGNRLELARQLCNYADVLDQGHDGSGALDAYREAADICTELGARTMLGVCWMNEGVLWGASDNPAQAAVRFDQAEQVFRDLARWDQMAMVAHNRAMLLANQGRHQEALAAIARAREFDREAGETQLQQRLDALSEQVVARMMSAPHVPPGPHGEELQGLLEAVPGCVAAMCGIAAALLLLTAALFTWLLGWGWACFGSALVGAAVLAFLAFVSRYARTAMPRCPRCGGMATTAAPGVVTCGRCGPVSIAGTGR